MENNYDTYVAAVVNVEHDKGNRYRLNFSGIEECYSCLFDEKVFSAYKELFPITYLVSDFTEHLQKGITRFYLFPMKKDDLLAIEDAGTAVIEYFRKIVAYDYFALVGQKEATFYALPANKAPKIYKPLYFNPDKPFYETVLNKDVAEAAPIKKNNRKEVIEKLKQRIISQDEQVESLVTAVLSNQKYASYEGLKNNIMIVGTTGTGKTEMCRSLSKILDIPFVKVDATKYTSTGYVGKSVLDILADLYVEADYDLEKAESGIVFIDEIDKLSTSESNNTKVRTTDVQHELLGLLGNTTYEISVGKEQIEIDTSKITFILAGAFQNIFDEFEKSRNRSIGFSDPNDKAETSQLKVKRSDLISSGIESELLRRVPVLIQMNTLTKEDLKKIATESKISNLRIWQDALFKEDNINLVYKPKTVDNIAEEAEKLCGGASGLQNVISNSLRDIIARAIDGELNDSLVIMQEDIVGDPSKYLVKRLEKGKEENELSSLDG